LRERCQEDDTGHAGCLRGSLPFACEICCGPLPLKEARLILNARLTNDGRLLCLLWEREFASLKRFELCCCFWYNQKQNASLTCLGSAGSSGGAPCTAPVTQVSLAQHGGSVNSKLWLAAIRDLAREIRAVRGAKHELGAFLRQKGASGMADQSRFESGKTAGGNSAPPAVVVIVNQTGGTPPEEPRVWHRLVLFLIIGALLAIVVLAGDPQWAIAVGAFFRGLVGAP
jgi:hypothetical protein